MVEAAFHRLAVMQVRARPVRVGFRLGFAAHALQVEVFQYDEVVFADEHAGGLVLPVVYDAVRLRVQSAEFPTGTLVGAARMTPVLFDGFAGHGDSSRLSLLTAAYFTVDTLQTLLGKVEETIVGRGERVRATPVQADHGTRALTAYRQRVVDEHERASCPVHPDARIVAYGLADADTNVDAVPAWLAVQTICAGVLSGDDDFAVMPVQPPVVRVRPLIVPADEVQVVTPFFEPGRHARVPMLFLQRFAALVRAPPVRVLYPVRGLQHHCGDGREPRAFQSNLTVGTHVRPPVQRDGRLGFPVPLGATGAQLIVSATPSVAQPAHHDVRVGRIQGDLLSVWGRTHAEIRCGTPHLRSFYHDLLGHDSGYITTRV